MKIEFFTLYPCIEKMLNFRKNVFFLKLRKKSYEFKNIHFINIQPQIAEIYKVKYVGSNNICVPYLVTQAFVALLNFKTTGSYYGHNFLSFLNVGLKISILVVETLEK